MMFLPLLMNPWVILGAVLAVLSSYLYGHHVGWTERDKDAQVEVAKANDEARIKEQWLVTQVNNNATKLLEANNALDEKQSSLDRAIRAGRVRFPAARCPPATESAPAASGDSAEAPSESERQTLAAIAAIVADGDRAINQLNACIDTYDEVKDKLNGDR